MLGEHGQMDSMELDKVDLGLRDLVNPYSNPQIDRTLLTSDHLEDGRQRKI